MAQDKKMSKGLKFKRRKINKTRLALLVVVGLVVAYFVVSALKIIRLNEEKAQVEATNKELKETVEDLTQQLEVINSPQYMERLARKKLKLVRSNEILFILPDIRANAEDEEMGPTDMAQTEAHEMAEAKKAEEEKKAQEEAQAEAENKDKDKSDDESKDDKADDKDSKDDKGDKDSGDSSEDGGNNG